jgi:hypothetical protein
MKRFGNDVNATGYEYRPYSQNSNSFAAGALKRAGFFGPGTAFPEISDRLIAFDPASGEAGSVRVPGFDQRLTNPIHEPAASSNGPTPFIPASAFPLAIGRTLSATASEVGSLHRRGTPRKISVGRPGYRRLVTHLTPQVASRSDT